MNEEKTKGVIKLIRLLILSLLGILMVINPKELYGYILLGLIIIPQLLFLLPIERLEK